LTDIMPIKILIVDQDSAFREVIYSALSDIELEKIVRQASDYNSVLNKISFFNPDLVLLEFELPAVDIRKIMTEFRKKNPNVEIILMSEKHRTNEKSSLMALNLGAMYFIRKPKCNNTGENIRYFKKYLSPIIGQFRVSRITSKVRKVSRDMVDRKPIQKQLTKSGKSKSFDHFDILAVGSSLGGIDALYEFIPNLPGNFSIPVVIVQHMPSGFTNMFSNNLNEKSQLIVLEAQADMKLRPGNVYIAPGGKHLEVRRNVGANQYITFLNNGPLVNGCRPAVNVLFKSLDSSISGNILTVILSGMGSDGLDSIRLMKKKGNCYCITQDEKTCVVYGMPGEISKAGLSDISLPVNKIADYVVKTVMGKKRSAAAF